MFSLTSSSNSGMIVCFIFSLCQTLKNRTQRNYLCREYYGKTNSSARSSHLGNEILQSNTWRWRFTFMAVMCSELKLMRIQMPHKRSRSRTKWRCIEGNYLPWEVSSAICSPLRLWRRRNRLNLGPLTRGPRCNSHIKSIVSCCRIVMRLFKRRKVRIAARRALGNVIRENVSLSKVLWLLDWLQNKHDYMLHFIIVGLQVYL